MKPTDILSDSLTEMAVGVDQFQRDIMALPCAPRRLPPNRKKFRLDFLAEELQEYRAAETQEDEIDALVDLVYVAIGALLEMGIDPSAAFRPVQDANMAKVRGETSRGAFYDAVKPEGWKPPDHEAVILDLALRQAISPVFIECTKIVLERGAAYNHGSEVRREDHFPFGLMSIFSLMWVKVKRMEADLHAGRKVKRDHAIDLINYARFMVDFLDGREMK